MRNMKWNGPTTTRLLNALCASPSLETFIMVNLKRSDLSEDDSCIAMGKFLATATDLNQFDIGTAEGRQIIIQVDIVAEGASGSGLVTIEDKATGKKLLLKLRELDRSES